MSNLLDPLAMHQFLWPDSILYDKQVEVYRSVESTPETYVPAANKMG